MNDPELKKKAESVLFSAGKKLPISEIARLCGKRQIEEVETALRELKEDYTKIGGSLLIIDHENEWRITVKERYMPYARRLATKTEFSKTLMETLAVTAYKAPVLQAEIVKIRTNKAYNHLEQLEQEGYIQRSKHGRTKLIRLAQKFFDYFDIPPDSLKQKFERVAEMEQVVREAEEEKKTTEQKFEDAKIEAKRVKEDFKKQNEAESKQLTREIEGMPKVGLETYDAVVQESEEEYPQGTTVETEKLGVLEVYAPGEKERKKEKKKKEKKTKHKKKAKNEKIKKTASKQKCKKEPEETEETEKEETPQEEKAGASEKMMEEAFKKAEPLFSGGISEQVQKQIDEKARELVTSKKQEEKRMADNKKREEEYPDQESSEETKSNEISEEGAEEEPQAEEDSTEETGKGEETDETGEEETPVPDESPEEEEDSPKSESVQEEEESF